MSFKVKIRNAIKNNLFRVDRILQSDRNRILAGQIRANQILTQGELGKLSDAGFSVFSQTDEDGVLSWLIDKLQIENETFIEFGVHDYRESNTRYLLMTRNWKGLVIDGDPNNIDAINTDFLTVMYDLIALDNFITRENIQSLIDGSGIKGRLGILSTDIDGVDYWVLEEISTEADIIVVEFNDFLGDAPVSVPYTPDFNRFTASPYGCYWGASLAAFKHLLEGKGYQFVGTNRLGINAFFVHADHAQKMKKELGEFRHHPCRMRESRDASGKLAYKPFTAFANEVAKLPVVRVDTNETIELGSVCKR